MSETKSIGCRDCRYYMPPSGDFEVLGGFCLAFIYDDAKAELIEQDATTAQGARDFKCAFGAEARWFEPANGNYLFLDAHDGNRGQTPA